MRRYQMSLDDVVEYEDDDEDDENEAIADIETQVDYWGEDSLTENQQALYRGYITFQQYMKLENE